MGVYILFKYCFDEDKEIPRIYDTSIEGHRLDMAEGKEIIMIEENDYPYAKEKIFNCFASELSHLSEGFGLILYEYRFGVHYNCPTCSEFPKVIKHVEREDEGIIDLKSD